ncbi:MAG: prepilin-type N-terminal cleavage/methylation domain-containing protein [Helicobacteraceae bacterium]|nr:prepilin-type N-terminal cleavage/methylation domain-containing protein [Helicobacteraceae bacterium]
MKRNGFSMIELVFVIVILGVLAAVAVPRFVTTRTDAQVAMLRSDIASVLKAIPARVFAENLDPTQSTPPGYSNWGEWMIDTGGMDRGRWMANKNYITPTYSQAQVNLPCSINDGIISIEIASGNLIFNPNAITSSSNGRGTTCNNLRDSYPSGSNRIIPLATTGAVKF